LRSADDFAGCITFIVSIGKSMNTIEHIILANFDDLSTV